VAAGHVGRQRRTRDRLVSIESIETLPEQPQSGDPADSFERLSRLIQRLKPLDRQIIVCYLEGMDAAATGEVTGLSPGNIAVKVHRIKAILRRWFEEGAPHA
jgi:RNA polymerase sigma-70 factor (ECF subfamily)